MRRYWGILWFICCILFLITYQRIHLYSERAKVMFELTHWGWATHICDSELLPLGQVMDWSLSGAMPLPEPIKWTIEKKIVLKYDFKCKDFHTRELIGKCRLQTLWPYCSTTGSKIYSLSYRFLLCSWIFINSLTHICVGTTHQHCFR